MISLTPLTDVVLILLIFFMITGKLVEADPFEIAPPRSASDGQSDTRDMLVLVGEDGRLALDGRLVDAAELRSAMQNRLSTNEATVIRLKADSLVPATRVIAVMEILQDAGVEELKLLTVQEGN